MSLFESIMIKKERLLRSVAECITYQHNWTPEFCRSELNELVDGYKTTPITEEELRTLSKDELHELGFRQFEKDSNLHLIPLWLHLFLDPDMDVKSFTGKESKLSEADKDNRYGLLAFGLEFDF